VSVDPLSSVLRAVRLTGAIFFDVAASSPWVAETPRGATIVADVMPGAQHLISYHVVTKGTCFGSLPDGPPIQLEAGDVIVFPHGDAHVLGSAPGLRGSPNLALYRRPVDHPLPFSLVQGSGGEETAHVVCGFLGCDARPFNPLLATLPPLLHVSERDAPRGGVLGHFVELARSESTSQRAGAECVLGKLSELMFVEVVRRYVEGLPPEQTGWLAALRDPSVGKSLGLLHANPAHPWTIEELARKVGLARSSLAERFAHLVGHPPMQYLTSWRLQLAARLLAEGALTVAAVAAEVGYQSEAAFSRAFRKATGVPPATALSA
jgi:AraC-like DNA-binding protein